MVNSKQKKSKILLYGMLALTLFATGFTYFQEINSAHVVSAISTTPGKTSRITHDAGQKSHVSSNVAIPASKRLFYEPSTDIFGIFKAAAEEERPSEQTPSQIISEPRIQTVEIQPALEPAPPPTTPPIPFKYIGKLFGDDEYIVFLHLNGRNISAKTGDTIAQSYKIEEINPPLMTATYLPLNIKQTIDIGAP